MRTLDSEQERVSRLVGVRKRDKKQSADYGFVFEGAALGEAGVAFGGADA